MGKKAIDILQIDVKKLIDMLNAALSEEWLAYYQYWIGARVIEGPLPRENDTDFYIEVILDQNLNGERCAIQRYKEIADFTNGKDHTTHQIATTILGEEIEHENDIEDWITDINRMKEALKK